MNPHKVVVIVCLSLLTALVFAQPALAIPSAVQPSGLLNVSFSYNPNVVTLNSQTMISYSINGNGFSPVPPFTIWVNGTPSGCAPPSIPFTTSNASATFNCNPTTTGNFNVHVDVHDNAGNQGSTQAYLTVNSNSGGGSGGSGSGTGSNNTGGIDLSFLQNLLPVVMITGILFLGSTVAIAVSAVALAILVPKRLKQIRKVLEGQPLKPSKAEAPATPPPPKEQPPGNEL